MFNELPLAPTIIDGATAMHPTVNRGQRLLERVRALLLGTRKSDIATPDSASANERSLPVRCPSREMWGAVLVGARRRRAPHLWPHELPAVEDDLVTKALVRTYVLPRAGEAR